MALSDPIADLLTRMRNAKTAKHRYFDARKSAMIVNILKVLEQQGFIENFLANDEKRIVRIFLRYGQTRDPVVQNLKRISCPGLRRYIGYKQIPKVLGGLGLAILSTSQGVMDGESARKLKVGGELLCTIW